MKKLIISEVTQLFEKLEVVEEEVRQKFADIDVAVVSMKSLLKCGCLNQCRVRMTPVNLKTIGVGSGYD